MKHSLTYYITLFVLRLKGIKKQFSQDPIDYQKVRKEDVHSPKSSFFRSERVRRFQVADSDITEVKANNETTKLIVFIHGGAFISGPAKHHWDTVKTISEKTSNAIWMCDYPKAPEHTIDVITQNIDRVYEKVLEEYSANEIILIGDSVGGNLILTLVQRLVQSGSEIPNKLILVSPILDASFDNPAIDSIESNDPILSKSGVRSAKMMAAGKRSLKDPVLSPLLGSFEGFPETVMYLGENDISYPDQLLGAEKMRNAGIDLTVRIGGGMPHIWPFLPVMKEAKLSLADIINQLNKE